MAENGEIGIDGAAQGGIHGGSRLMQRGAAGQGVQASFLCSEEDFLAGGGPVYVRGGPGDALQAAVFPKGLQNTPLADYRAKAPTGQDVMPGSGGGRGYAIGVFRGEAAVAVKIR